MIKFKIKGPWKESMALLKNYDKRFRFVRRRTLLDVAEALKDKILEIAPKGPEFDDYRESLRVVEITGVSNGMGFAVVSDRRAVKLGDIAVDEAMKTVVYIEYAGGGEMPELIAMVSQINPWPVEMVPHGLDPNTTSMIHRQVSEDEYNYARQNAMEFIHDNRDVIKAVGGSWGRPEKGQQESTEMKSLPDYLSLALRMEFGMGGQPSKPHWRPALRDVMKRVSKLMKNDEKIQLALYDKLFREHLESSEVYENQLSQQDFDKEAGKFQKAVAGVIGGEIG